MMRPAGIDWSFPHASKRAPVLARNVVATSQPLAASAGIEALGNGGNAVDAALATAIALTVVEPCNNGVGSDAFAIVWDGDRLVGLNASGRSPAAWTLGRFAHHGVMPQRGWDTVTVPGAVSAWVALSRRFGALPFPELFGAAIRYARHGFHVGHETAAIWARAADSFSDFPAFLEHFLPDGRAPAAGEVFVNPDLADTLDSIAQTDGESFYRGELADRMESTARVEGGALRRSDLAAHRPDWVEPLVQPYRGVALAEIPPNGQGLAAQIALAILGHLDAHRDAPGSARWTHLQIEAMKIAIRAAFDHFADADAMRLTPEALLEAESIAAAAAGIAERAAPLPPVALPVSQDTVYLTAADAKGMMVSMIQSNYMGFGSGIVVPGTGIALQNRGAGFVLDPTHPNVVGPNKRPYHTIIPGFVTRNGSPAMSFGVMGGHMQHQGHVQMVTRIFEHGENPQAASDAPRWHVTPQFTVALEEGYPADVAQDLTARGHTVEVVRDHRLFGGAQLIYCLPDGGYCGASDHRKEGAAVGF
ncbi:MAG: gamma-glutamyltransferase family protein [Gammaproteobacteria bacterium]|nr:gamma-glutamyltransferase family protein [Gammaproteobacteria bacterium]